MHMKTAVWSLGLVLALAGGCVAPMEQPYEVVDLRVLAIRADPPEVMADVDLEILEEYVDLEELLQMDPASFNPENLPDLVEIYRAGGVSFQSPVSLSVLAVDPRDPWRQQPYKMTLCSPPLADTRCDESRLSTVIASGTTALGQLTFEFVPTFALVEQAIKDDPFGGAFGMVAVQVELALGEGAEEVHAVKRVVYTIPFPVGKTANANPTAEGLLVDDLLVPPGELLVLEPGQRVELEPQLPEGQAETYQVITFDMEIKEVEEFLSVSYYSTEGSFSPGVTGGQSVTGSVFGTEDDDLASTYTAPGKPQQMMIWVVVRDDRGGISWLEQEVSVEE